MPIRMLMFFNIRVKMAADVYSYQAEASTCCTSSSLGLIGPHFFYLDLN